MTGDGTAESPLRMGVNAPGPFGYVTAEMRCKGTNVCSDESWVDFSSAGSSSEPRPQY